MSIVQDLYANIQRPHHDHGDSPMLRAGEISMEGYMEKLPMGRRRASFIKKWKKRYFRAKQGNLFYYEVCVLGLLISYSMKRFLRDL